MPRKNKPIKILTLDTETYNGLIGGLKKVAIYDGLSVIYGNTFDDVEKELIKLSKTFTLHIYIHNMEFDLRKLNILKTDRIIWEKSFIIKNKLATLSCKHYVFHDSFKLLPMSLKDLSGTKGFNVEHGKLDLWQECQKRYPNQYENLVDFLDRCPIDDTLFIEYLGYDVMSLYEVIQKLIEISGLSEKDFVKRISTASLSRYIFKKGWNGELFKNVLNTRTDYEFLSSYNWKNDIDTEEFLRASYCGGRTEVFKPLLDHSGYHYDVNSLYPSVMIKQDYPIGKPFFSEESNLAKHYFETWLEDKNGLGFICASVFIPEQHIPPLPLKMNKLVFACGNVYGTWTYEELEYAIKECGVLINEYHAVCHFNQTYPVFHNFIERLYTLKEDASIKKNYALRTFAKLLMNVGYGYTGMRRDDKTSLIPYEERQLYDNIIYSNEELGYCEIPTEIEAEYIQVQIASYVTSRARLVLLKALRSAEATGANIYYCDTDSIVTDKPFPANLIDENKLGFWACENEPDKALFLRPKVYAEVFENVVVPKFKGVSRDTQKTLDFESYENLYKEMIEQKKDSVIIERNKTTFRSIMYMQKEQLPDLYYEERDKKININTVEKRKMNYKENYTKPYFFNSIKEFETFSFKPPKPEVVIDMTKGGHY